MNPFDGLTPRQHKLVQLALDFMRLTAWAGEIPAPPEVKEYADLLILLAAAKTV